MTLFLAVLALILASALVLLTILWHAYRRQQDEGLRRLVRDIQNFDSQDALK